MEKEEPKEPPQLKSSEVIEKLAKIMVLINKIARDKGYFKRGFGWEYKYYSNMTDSGITITLFLYYYSKYFGRNAKLCK